MKKIINSIMAIIFILSSVLPIILEIKEVYAADYTITYNGPVQYGLSKVRRF